MSTQTIWVIEDDASIRWVLEKALQKLEVRVASFENASQALEQILVNPPDVIITDIRMPGISGLDFMHQLKQKSPQTPVIVMTAYSDLETTVDAFKKGAFDYIAKPFDIQQALEVIKKALVQSQQANRTQPTTSHPKDKIIGESAAIQKIFTAIGRLSNADINVLLYGESGTGKELVANALFENSPRSHKPFITINTAAIPTELLESELFGHEKGAFTGATARRIGRFEQASQGTLFLDEIGDMPLELQTRLLRVLQDGKFYRVGGHELIQSDVRVIAATNQKLDELVTEGRFREDLYHRLNVIQIELPPLRQRYEDIILLSKHFLNVNAASLGIEVKQLTPQAVKLLSHFHWPGNVRQLENACRWMMVMTPSSTIQAGDLPDYIIDQPASDQTRTITSWASQLVENIEQSLQAKQSNLNKAYNVKLETILYGKVLEFTDWHKIKAANILGVSRNTITRKIRELNLKPNLTNQEKSESN